MDTDSLTIGVRRVDAHSLLVVDGSERRIQLNVPLHQLSRRARDGPMRLAYGDRPVKDGEQNTRL